MSINTIIKNQDLAVMFCQSEPMLQNLLYITGFNRFCLFNKTKGYFEILSNFDFTNIVYHFLVENTSKNLTMSITKDVAEQVKVWCYKKHKNFYSDYVSFSDKLLNTKTNQLEDFDPQKISFIAYPATTEQYLNNPQTEAPPLFKNFLEFVLVSEKKLTPNPELITMMQELFGYCLLPTTNAEATFFFVGEGANGKSKLLDILVALVGEENYSAQSIESLTNNKFALASLIGKRINLCTEESSDFVKQDKFKALISGEAVEVEKKFESSFVEKLPVKFIFATNEMPSFSGFNTAFCRRIKMIPFHRTIKPEERDPQIAEKVLVELPQIYLWALAGMKRLLQNRMQFSGSDESDKAARELESSMASSIMYIREKYEEEEGAWLSNEEIYYDYKEVWCKNVGKKPVNLYRFFKEINLDLKLPMKFQKKDGISQRGRQLIPRKYDPEMTLEDIANMEPAQLEF